MNYQGVLPFNANEEDEIMNAMPTVKAKKPKKKSKLTPLQKTLLGSEFRRDPFWSSSKVRRMARFL